jgi:uncharacterized protein (DUF58 family)
VTPAAAAQAAGAQRPAAAVPTELLNKIRRIEIRARRLLNTALLGEYHSVFKGRGMEFSDVREYVPGDDVRAIDWSVTARMNAPFIKQYVEERELTVILAVDVSASGAFGSSGRSKLEVATEIAALLAFSAIRNNDKVGLLAFSDRIEKYLPPRKGRQHVLRVIRELVFVQPEGRGTDISAALAYLGRVQRRRAVVFLISDFYAQNFTATLRVAGRRHDVVALALTDPAELQLPVDGLVRLEDAETGAELVVDAGDQRVRAAYHRLALEARAQRTSALSAVNVDTIEVTTDEPYAKPLYRFFQRRSRRS